MMTRSETHPHYPHPSLEEVRVRVRVKASAEVKCRMLQGAGKVPRLRALMLMGGAPGHSGQSRVARVTAGNRSSEPE
jgi:hypothetical protein